MKKELNNERGSLSLEHILFIGAVVALSVGITAFYGNISTYFQTVGFGAAPQNIGAGTGGGTTTGGN